MKRLSLHALAIILLSTFAGTAAAADSLKVGDAVGAFYVSKVAGAEDDGVNVGQELCYRCRYGSRPMVMVFTRQANGKLTELVKELDAAISTNEETQLRGLITFMGNDVAEVKDNASEFAKTSGAKQVPIVIAKETKTGPPNYRLDDSAVTIFIARDSQVVSVHRGEADDIDVPTLMRQVKKMLSSDKAKNVASPL